MPRKKKEDAPDMSALTKKLSDVLTKLHGIDIEGNTDKLIEAVSDFGKDVDKFQKKIAEIERPFKELINLGIIIDIKYAGDSKICVVGGDRRHICERLDEIKEQVKGAKKDDNT